MVREAIATLPCLSAPPASFLGMGANMVSGQAIGTLEKLRADLSASAPLPTGFSALDDHLSGGLSRGSLTVVAGHPGAGGTTLALNIFRSAAVRHGVVTRYLSLDSEVNDLARRLVCAEAGVRMRDMAVDVDTRTSRNLINAHNKIAAARLTFTKLKNRKIEAILIGIEQDIWGDHVGLTVVDPLNYVGAESAAAGSDVASPELHSNVTADFARRLKLIATDNQVAILVVVGIPLSATTPAGSDGRMYDFHAIGPIGQYADNVLLLYRADQWTRAHPRGGEADILVAKGKQFPTTITVAHQLHLYRFVDLPHDRAHQLEEDR
ncbi:hypothetical protein NGTWS1803_37910 [Mycolicibacterium cyprinidarum]|nr:hypothetical protein NGTWS1803_37910 [Mycolicibacterium sp. NGTWS1803]